MNTILKPRTKVSECSITVRNIRRCGVCNSSTLAPDISETYPGTKGSTHGDKNERSPAKKAARGRGRLCIPYSSNASAVWRATMLFDHVTKVTFVPTIRRDVANA